MSVTEQDLEAFGRLAAEQLRNGGAESLEELLSEWRKFERWNERNAISIQQSEEGLSKPLDLQAVLERVELRVGEGQENE
jgi:hypothetical protein